MVLTRLGACFQARFLRRGLQKPKVIVRKRDEENIAECIAKDARKLF
jgi:hypothetical protein